VKNTNLIEKFLLPGIELDELEQALGYYFGFGQQTSETEIIYKESETAPVGLSLKYTKKHKLTSIECGPGLSQSKLDALLERIQFDLLQDMETVVGGVIVFTSYPVHGYYRNDSFLQLRPIPSQAPHLPFSLGEHPSILEFLYKPSLNLIINSFRKERRGYELGILLHAFLEGVLRVKTSRVSSHWVYLPKEVDSPSNFAYCQEGYWCDGIPARDAEFSMDDTWQPMESIDPQSYYLTLQAVGSPLRVPSTLTTSLEKYHLLESDRRLQFLRACYWSHLAHQLSSYSQSAVYTALVNAVETLTPHAEVKGRCKECNREIKDGPTKLFKDFVEEFADGIARTSKDELYDIRSKLVHGGRLLGPDFPTFTLGFNPNSLGDSEKLREMARIVKVVLYNWLHLSEPRLSPPISNYGTSAPPTPTRISSAPKLEPQ
jgi:hypothetical protein